MSDRSAALLALTLTCGACGADTPAAPGGEGDRTSIKLEPGQCWTEDDCKTGEACKPDAFIESTPKNISISTAGNPGDCEMPPSEQMLWVTGVSPIRFEESASSLDPTSSDFTIDGGSFDIEFAVEVQGTRQAFEGAFEFPAEASKIPGFGFYWMVDWHLHLIDPDNPAYDVECDLRFLRDGNVLGGVTRGPGVVACSKDNWQAPENAGDAGLLVEFEIVPVNPLEEPIDPNGKVCGDGALSADGATAVGSVACRSFSGEDSPMFEVLISAQPLGPIGEESAFEVRAQLVHPEAFVDQYIDIIDLQLSVLAEARVYVDQVNGSSPTILAVDAPCELDYTHDANDNGTPGPVALTTEAATAVWTPVDGSVILEATHIAFRLSAPLDVHVSTDPSAYGTSVADPGCTWLEVPRLTFDVVE